MLFLCSKYSISVIFLLCHSTFSTDLTDDGNTVTTPLPDDLTTARIAAQSSGGNILFEKLSELQQDVIAGKRELIFKFNEISSKVNALKLENLQLKDERRENQLKIEKLQNRLSLVEERWQENRWKTLPNDIDALRRTNVDLSNRLESQIISTRRLQDDASIQDARLRRISEQAEKSVADLRKEFSGYSSMTFVFAQQTNQAINASESRLRETVDASSKRSQNMFDRLSNRYDRLSDQTDLAISRMKFWNVTRQLTQCQKLVRDNHQEKQITHIGKQLTQVKKLASFTSNRTNKLESILYDNNRITNGLSDFKKRASTAIEKLITNFAQIAKIYPTDCSAAHKKGKRTSGIYVILPKYNLGQLLTVKCRFSDANGWTVIQNRQTLNVDFNQKFQEYEKGFGDVKGDYWLGLQAIHQIVSRGDWKLRIEFWDSEGRYYYADYLKFYIHDSLSNYQLKISDYRGNATDSLSRVSGSGFSTPDFDADATVMHCSRFEESGWWMKHCHDSNLNGKDPFGIIWYHETSKDYLTLVRTRMMIATVTEEDLRTTTPTPTTTTRIMTTPRLREEVTDSTVSTEQPLITTVTDSDLNNISTDENFNDTGITEEKETAIDVDMENVNFTLPINNDSNETFLLPSGDADGNSSVLPTADESSQSSRLPITEDATVSNERQRGTTNGERANIDQATLSVTKQPSSASESSNSQEQYTGGAPPTTHQPSSTLAVPQERASTDITPTNAAMTKAGQLSVAKDELPNATPAEQDKVSAQRSPIHQRRISKEESSAITTHHPLPSTSNEQVRTEDKTAGPVSTGRPNAKEVRNKNAVGMEERKNSTSSLQTSPVQSVTTSKVVKYPSEEKPVNPKSVVKKRRQPREKIIRRIEKEWQKINS